MTRPDQRVEPRWTSTTSRRFPRRVVRRIVVMALMLPALGCQAGSGQPESRTSIESTPTPVSEPDDDQHRQTSVTSGEQTPTTSIERVSAPLVIAHRGASGYRPEHTMAAFALAIEMGADMIEPDIVMTRDGHAIVRHENELSLTTDVADRVEFAGRLRTKTVDGRERTGFFSEDFTLEEIRTLRAVERDAALRPESAEFDGQEAVPTLRDVLAFLAETNERASTNVGVYPEIKHISHFRALGLDVAAAVVADLEEFGYVSEADPALIQSKEVDVLRELNEVTDLRLVQLLGSSGAPYDQVIKGSGLTFAEMATPAGLSAIADYADGIAVQKNRYVIPLDDAGGLDVASATAFVDDAHAASLFVHVYTFRAENEFLPTNLRSDTGDPGLGDLVSEIEAFTGLGIEGIFVDHVDLGRLAVPDE